MQLPATRIFLTGLILAYSQASCTLLVLKWLPAQTSAWICLLPLTSDLSVQAGSAAPTAEAAPHTALLLTSATVSADSTTVEYVSCAGGAPAALSGAPLTPSALAETTGT